MLSKYRSQISTDLNEILHIAFPWSGYVPCLKWRSRCSPHTYVSPELRYWRNDYREDFNLNLKQIGSEIDIVLLIWTNDLGCLRSRRSNFQAIFIKIDERIPLYVIYSWNWASYNRTQPNFTLHYLFNIWTYTFAKRNLCTK